MDWKKTIWPASIPTKRVMWNFSLCDLVILLFMLDVVEDSSTRCCRRSISQIYCLISISKQYNKVPECSQKVLIEFRFKGKHIDKSSIKVRDHVLRNMVLIIPRLLLSIIHYIFFSKQLELLDNNQWWKRSFYTKFYQQQTIYYNFGTELLTACRLYLLVGIYSSVNVLWWCYSLIVFVLMLFPMKGIFEHFTFKRTNKQTLVWNSLKWNLLLLILFNKSNASSLR